jgi:O-antigen/teichoic acid export membrane protein
VAVLAEQPEATVRVGWRAGIFDAGPLAIAAVVANGGSVLVTLVLARLLVAREYGALNQLIGVFFVVSTPGSAVLVGVVRRVTRWAGDLEAVARWGTEVHRRATWLLGLFVVAVVASGPWVAGLLGRQTSLGFDAVAIAGSVWVLLCIDRGLLQARREYRMLAGNLLLEGGARTAFMVSFGAAGLGVSGVALGVLVAEVCTAVQARVLADRAWRGVDGTRERWAGAWRPARWLAAAWRPARWRAAAWRPARWRAVQWRPTRTFERDGVARRDLASAVVALAAVAVLQYVDVIVMGRAAPAAAGGYAAVSVSSKALVFIAIVVAGYLLPEAAISWREGSHALRQLAISLAIIAVPAAVLVAVAAAVPRAFLSVAFSHRYVSAAVAFLPLALSMVCLAATVIVTMYLLGVGDRLFVAVLVAGAALATVAVVLAGGAPRTTALADLAVQGVLLCAGVAELARVHRRRDRAPCGPLVPDGKIPSWRSRN